MESKWIITVYVFILISMFGFGFFVGYHTSEKLDYKQGQIDCMEGRIKYHKSEDCNCEVEYKEKI